MKKILKKTVAIFGGVVATLGFSISSAPAHQKTANKTEIFQVKEDSPLYLDHATKLFSNTGNFDITSHWSHSSHRSHWSHSSHRSHSSHYSGY